MSLFGARDNEDSAALPEDQEVPTWPLHEDGSEEDGSEEEELFTGGVVRNTPAVVGEVATPAAEAASIGLYGKFRVERSDGRDRPGGDKDQARYFVLDYVNDPVARIALRAYVTELKKRGTEPELAKDLNAEINATFGNAAKA